MCPKPSIVKIGILLEDNITQADSNSDVNFSVNNQTTSLYHSLSFRVSFVYEVHLYTPKKKKKPTNPKQYNCQLQ